MVQSAAFVARPEHTITVTPFLGRVAVTFKGALVAVTERALQLNEGGNPPVFYVPRADCKLEHFIETDHQTISPFKGTARYWSLSSKDGTAANAVWSYDQPYDQVSDISGHVAFYSDKVDIRANGR